MKVEVVNIYIEERDEKNLSIKASAHIYMPEFDLDVRGIDVSIKKGKHWITIPTKTKFDAKTKENITFPIIQFANREKTLGLRKAIIKACLNYMKENNYISPKKTKQKVSKPDNKKIINNRLFQDVVDYKLKRSVTNV